MATQYDPIAKDESLNTTENPSRNIADVLAEGLSDVVTALGGGSLASLSDVTISTPSNGQTLKYNSTTQKWENANESGGGTAAQVSYDNTSSHLSATDVQGAIDEVKGALDEVTQSVDTYVIKLSDLTWATEAGGKYYAIAKPISDFSGRKVIGVFLSSFGGLRSTDLIQCWFNDISGLFLTSGTTSFAYGYSYVTVSIVSVPN